MIVKTSKGYVVYSEDKKKRLSKPLTKAAAKARLAQVEAFKHAEAGGTYGGKDTK